MGFSGIGFTELLLLCVIIVLLFGTKKLSTLGSDLGSAIRGFRQAMSEGNQPSGNSATPSEPPASLPHSSAVHSVHQGIGATMDTPQPSSITPQPYGIEG